MSKTFFKLGFGVVAVVVLTLTGTLQAAPFDRQITFKQPDGTMIQLHGWGDEFQAVFETQAGFTVVFDQARQAYCYARQDDASGQLVSLGVQAHLASPAGLARHQRMSFAARKSQVVARWQRWENGMHIQAQWDAKKAALAAITATNGSIAGSPPTSTTTGVKVGLTLLVDFSDDPATVPQAEIINFCNGDNYTGFGNNGSVKSYYYDNSAGLLTYTNVVTIYVRAPQPKSVYNDITKDAGDNANTLIKDALDTLKALPNYTTDILPMFANLTVDASSQVVAFNVFYAGDNGGVWSMGLWPHSWVLYNVGAQDLGDGKSVYKYEISNIGASLELGTFCHENGHMLCGYPDIYDYGYDSVGGAGDFCLMAYGSFGGNPSQICAYLKRASGWANTVELDYTSSLVATAGTTGTNFNRFYRYQKPGVPTEYYLIENRERIGRDAQLPASGLAIWHIDELGDRDNQSTNYNTSHLNYEVSLMQADNLWDFQNNINAGDPEDLYYASNSAVGYVNAFSDTNSPSARWWNGTASGLRITEITNPSTNMTFRVGTASGGTPPVNPSIISAPQAPWGTTLSALNGGNPNGDWYLFVQDTSPLQSGVISNGWYVTLTTANPVGFSADNQIVATPGSLTNVIGAHWNLTLAVTNFGPSISSNVYVSDALPLGLTLVASNTLSGTVSQIGSRLLSWNVGTLAVGAGATLNLDLTSAASGVYTNTATVAADTADANADDDSVSSILLVSGPVIAPQLTPSFSFSGGKFLLGVSGSPVSTVIQASTNLSNWVSVYTNTPPFTFTNFDSTNYQMRFYRAVTGL